MLKEWQSENGGIIYSYFDTYAAINDLIQSPASYGILVYYHTLLIIFSMIVITTYIHGAKYKDEVQKPQMELSTRTIAHVTKIIIFYFCYGTTKIFLKIFKFLVFELDCKIRLKEMDLGKKYNVSHYIFLLRSLQIVTF